MKTKFIFFLMMVFSVYADAQVTNGLIQHFKFDNSYTNETGNISFSSTAFTEDRDGVPNSAIRIANSLVSQAVIPGLPYGNTPRTIAFWVKANSFSGLNYDPVFTYGTATSGNSNGGGFSADRVMFMGHTDNLTLLLGNQNVVGTWYHITLTYDGTTAKIYRNGFLLGQLDKNWNTINNNDIFKLGIGVGGEQWFNGAIDDLKIYNRALSSAEAEELYRGDINICSGILSYFSFNGTASNQNSTSVFTTTDPTYLIYFTADKNGNNVAALQTFQAPAQPREATIPGLPIGNSPRTIAFWMRTATAFSTSQTYFSYGTSANARTFGLYNNSAGRLVFQGFGTGNDVVTDAQIGQNSWAHISITFNTYMVRVYVNGVLRHSFIPATTLNTGNSTFKIGAFNGAVDDLTFYNRALTFAEIESLYTNSVMNCSNLSIQQDLVKKNTLKIYPNPVKDILNVASFSDIKRIEIYTMDGKKVKEGAQKNIDVSLLPRGVYLVNILDKNNITQTQKVVKD